MTSAQPEVPAPRSDARATGLADAIARLAYRTAYRVALAWWWLRRPRTTGVLVALWQADRVLLVRTSYRPVLSFPGGFVRPGEPEAEAAARELQEEVGIHVDGTRLRVACHSTLSFEFRQDEATIFEAHLDAPSPPTVDQREIVWAAWLTRDEAVRQPLLPHVRAYLR